MLHTVKCQWSSEMSPDTVAKTYRVLVSSSFAQRWRLSHISLSVFMKRSASPFALGQRGQGRKFFGGENLDVQQSSWTPCHSFHEAFGSGVILRGSSRFALLVVAAWHGKQLSTFSLTILSTPGNQTFFSDEAFCFRDSLVPNVS